MLRPARVLMRERKPWLRARRRLLGWKVRFTGMFSLVSWGSPGGSTRAGPSGGARMGAGEVDAEDSDLTTLRCRSRYRQTDDPAPPDHQVTPMKPHLCSHLTRLASHSNRLRMSQGLTSVQGSGTSWVACHTDCGKLCGQLSTTSREQVVECPTHRSATPTTLVPRRSIRMLYCPRR